MRVTVPEVISSAAPRASVAFLPAPPALPAVAAPPAPPAWPGPPSWPGDVPDIPLAPLVPAVPGVPSAPVPPFAPFAVDTAALNSEIPPTVSLPPVTWNRRTLAPPSKVTECPLASTSAVRPAGTLIVAVKFTAGDVQLTP